MIIFYERRDSGHDIYNLHGYCAEGTNLKIFSTVWPEYDGSKRQLPVRLPGRPEASRLPCFALCTSASHFITSCESTTRFEEFRFAYNELYNYLLFKNAWLSLWL